MKPFAIALPLILVSACCVTATNETGAGSTSSASSASATGGSGAASSTASTSGAASGTASGTTGATSGASGGSSTSGSSGSACANDSDCGAHAYCLQVLAQCNGPDLPGTFESMGGTCHRNCSDGSCTCQDDADCGPGSCANGECLAAGVDCIQELCPTDCPSTSLTQEYCPLCICASCTLEPLDAGADTCAAGIVYDAGLFLPSYAPHPVANWDPTTSTLLIGNSPQTLCSYPYMTPGSAGMILDLFGGHGGGSGDGGQGDGSDDFSAQLFLTLDGGFVIEGSVSGSVNITSATPSGIFGTYDLTFPGPCAFPPEPCNSERSDEEIGTFAVSPADACLCAGGATDCRVSGCDPGYFCCGGFAESSAFTCFSASNGGCPDF